MKVLFIGPKLGNSYLQYLALKKIYKNVDFIDGFKVFFLPFLTRKIFNHVTPLILQFYINHYILIEIHMILLFFMVMIRVVIMV